VLVVYLVRVSFLPALLVVAPIIFCVYGKAELKPNFVNPSAARLKPHFFALCFLPVLCSEAAVSR